jgi:hypothetical protein
VELVERGEYGFAVMHGDRLGHLKLEPMRRNPRIRKRADNDRHEVLAPELSGSEVDRDLEIGGPFGRLGTGGPQHPFPERHNQACFFGQRDEFGRQDQAALGMMPTQQRLKAAGSPLVTLMNGW